MGKKKKEIKDLKELLSAGAEELKKFESQLSEDAKSWILMAEDASKEKSF